MKKILLLFTQRSVESGASDPQALCAALQAAAGNTTHYDFALYETLLHRIGPDAAILLADGTPLDEYDLVYQRRWQEAADQALSVAIYLRKKGVPYVDAESDFGGSISKLTQHWRMWEHDIPCPRTVFAAAPQLRDWVQSHLEQTFALPCIMKSTNGTRGNDNYLVHSVDDALDIVSRNPGMAFLVQEFIPNDGDYRAFVCGDQVALTIHRTRNVGSHKNNTSRGGNAELVSNTVLAPGVQQTCIKAAKTFGRDIAGVDVVFRKDNPAQYYIFEVNRAPQIDASSYTDAKAAAVQAYFTKKIGGGV